MSLNHVITLVITMNERGKILNESFPCVPKSREDLLQSMLPIPGEPEKVATFENS